MRILVVADDPLLGDGLRIGLSRHGFEVDWVQDDQAAEREMRAEPYAVVVLSLARPQANDIDTLAAMRACSVATPVLVLAERDAMPERIRGLETGADDYCAKPVDLHELAARLRALVRHARGQPQECLRLHGLVLDPAALAVSLDGEPVLLKPREFDLLHLLMLNVGRVLSREQLGQQLHRWGQKVQSNTVEVHVHHLRRKLRPELIRTVRGVGYVLPRDPGAHP